MRLGAPAAQFAAPGYAVDLPISTVGNPYLFTGRRTHFIKADFGGDPDRSKQIHHRDGTPNSHG